MASTQSSNDEIIITFTYVETGQTESITVSSSDTTLKSAREWACALFGLGDGIQLVHDGRVFETTSALSLREANIKHGDMIAVTKTQRKQQQSLDFSNILANNAPTASSNNNNNTGGLTFDLNALSSGITSTASTTQEPVEWSGMTLDDAMQRNPNPSQLVPLLLKNETLMKQLNHHSPNLAHKLKSTKNNLEEAIRLWRAEMFKGSLGMFTKSSEKNRKRSQMEARLRQDPMDEEANAYFGDEIRNRNVEQQYLQMMEDYPESMGRVLMLYIDAIVNGHAIQAFVDSGAQNTIMSSACAERCGLLHLLDTRFEGIAVGVGTGKILGRVHVAQLQIGTRYFPCSITIMDSEKGLGDKNMDFLFGLDMLKRHRCKIDLGSNALVFSISKNDGDIEYMEAPFLHEKDLEESKGGTKGFNADKSNEELTKRMLEVNQDDDNMDVDSNNKNDGEETKDPPKS
uniref:Aspartic peptidase DDI1-type domain-containing protein n=1 Tax=Eucampia antarctica TaxID=49252 RepID=A0A7S2W4P4_9STRA|mmetsp:Transcript_20826/g.20048  ORF Transcript_20826/g.20048 Transcript_20826/m.20048 type:complete len:458 (+) Transcript_20826:158-1531(+)|eukprot:CAMPEP_0197834606 /NCGR_PEP_ID=MMETSP1437-20131217/23031_1 /TAXON_ID=49252 ORGANISM="Eucampia antarctica, Strain CCMP1452" /NCGR_SAMPLE_ID=MMETSP1437 /ASSEMBLY_ACC=CAM_ASM_001096 /LENGTH=457 /DNA_ID=CAMNT_0043439427 /DNA_START=142 /DNA_END=1515 /DNA_ORIENTATION=+